MVSYLSNTLQAPEHKKLLSFIDATEHFCHRDLDLKTSSPHYHYYLVEIHFNIRFSAWFEIVPGPFSIPDFLGPDRLSRSLVPTMHDLKTK